MPRRPTSRADLNRIDSRLDDLGGDAGVPDREAVYASLVAVASGSATEADRELLARAPDERLDTLVGEAA